MTLLLKRPASTTIKPNVQYYAGKLLGFYEAGDMLFTYLNSLDTSEMTAKELRKLLTHKILELKPRLERGRTDAT